MDSKKYVLASNRFVHIFNQLIDVKLGIIGALFMGSVVFYINADHGPFLASIAAMKQGLYTFFIGGIILKILEMIVTGINNKILAYICSVIAATVITVGLVYLVHSMKGTPKPFESTIPTILLAPIGYIYVARMKRNNKTIPGFRKKS
jgi:hypothetical protein